LDKIRPFILTDEKFVRLYNEQMREDLLHVSDEARLPGPVFSGLLRVVMPGPHEIYEIGDCGVVVFRDIADGFKCYVSLILWDRGIWGHSIVREAKRKIEDVARAHKLIKMETYTADERVAKLARLLGFETEGYRTDSFLRGKDLYGVTLMGRGFPREEE
jgi:hypothetical protein